ncbi:MAG: mannosyltransferase [Aquaticitalea sp.]
MFNSTLIKLNKIPILFALLSVAFYISFAYDLVRTDYPKLILLYSSLFLLFYKLVQTSKCNFKFLVVVAIIIRLVFLFAMPNLSQDFYRFIWDGRMILEGMNPYLFTPESFINAGKFPISQAQELYNGMGVLNGSHYTNYPPIKQLIFTIAAIFSGKSILGSAIVFRIFIIAADIGTLYFGKKLLEKFKMPVHNIFWFILNPFIIIELTGSLHFEGIMIFFLVFSFYLLQTTKWKIAAVMFAISITVKLIPFMFLPLFFNYFKKGGVKASEAKQSVSIDEIASSQKPRNDVSKLFGFYTIILLSTLLLFLPFYNADFIDHYSDTVALWFGQFEFNASLYYIARAIGYSITGYNEIGIIGKFIPLVVTLVLIGFSIFRKNDNLPRLLASMLLISTFYYFTSTTIHPWYLATLVALSVFTNYKFPLVWSFMIVLSYFAYANEDYSENLWVVGLEYVVVYSVFIWEVFIRKINSQKPLSNSQNI